MTLSEFEENGTTFIIAEIAQAHDGSVGILHSLLDAAAGVGVNAVKFQVHLAEAESSPLEPFRVKFSHVDATRFDYWKRMELPVAQWAKLKARCDELGVEFLATPFSNAAVNLLESLGVNRYKVGSGDAGNPVLMEKLARAGKEVILSTGLSLLDELDSSVATLRARNIPVAVLQCTSRYPTSAEDIGLGWLAKFRDRYGCPVGLSDHSGTIYPGLGAVALGASLIEAHITFDKRMFGPDARASLTVDDFAKLVEGARFLEKARGTGLDKSADDSKNDLRRTFGKALAISCDLPAGHSIRFEDLEGKKPGDGGISVNDMVLVIGRRLARDMKRWEFITPDDLTK